MQCNKSLIIKPNLETIAKMFGTEVNPKATYSFYVSPDDVHVIATVTDGSEIFTEDRHICSKEIMTAYIIKRYSVPETISDQIYTAKDNTELVARFLLKDASAIGNRVPPAPAEDTGERSEAAAGTTSRRSKGAGKKLPVLSRNLHSGVQGS